MREQAQKNIGTQRGHPLWRMPLGVPSCVTQKLRKIQLRNRLLCVSSYFLFLETRATPPITATATATPAIGSASPVFGEEVEAAAAFLVVVVAGVAALAVVVAFGAAVVAAAVVTTGASVVTTGASVVGSSVVGSPLTTIAPETAVVRPPSPFTFSNCAFVPSRPVAAAVMV